MIKKLAFALMLLVSSLAYAQSGTYWYWGTLPSGTRYDKDADTACKNWIANRQANNQYIGYVFDKTTLYVDGSKASCYAKKDSSSVNVNTISKGMCPASKPFFDPVTSTCVGEIKPDCPKDTPGKGTWQAGWVDDSRPYTSPFSTGGCVNSCKVDMTDVQSCYSYDGDPKAYCVYSWKSVGHTCAVGDGTAQEAQPPNSPPKRQNVPPFTPPKGTCPKGSIQGGVDDHGTPICIGTGTAPQNQPPPPPKTQSSQTEATPDGGTKTTDTTVTRNSDGSSTTQTTTTTVDPNGVKTVVVTKEVSSNRDNSPGKDESNRDDDKYDLCKTNPMLNVCRNSSVSGSCGEISCMGDAIQCATLRAAAAMQCKQKQDEDSLNSSPLKAKGEAAINGTDLDGLPSPTKAQIYKIPGIESQGWLGAGNPFEDVRFVVQGHEIVVPLSEWTGYLVSLRYALMIIASMISFRILGSAILKE